MSRSDVIEWAQHGARGIEAYDKIASIHLWHYVLKANLIGALAGAGYYIAHMDQSLGQALGQFNFDPTLVLVFFFVEGISFVAHLGAGIWHGHLWARLLSWLSRSFVYVILLSGGAVVASVIRINDPDLAKSIVMWATVAYTIIEIFRYDLLTLAGSEPKMLSWIRVAKKTLKSAVSFEFMSVQELRRRAHDSVDSLAAKADEEEKAGNQ